MIAHLPRLCPILLLALPAAALQADFRLGEPVQSERPVAAYVPDAAALAAQTTSGLRELVERYRADFGGLERFHTVPGSALQIARFRGFHEAWRSRLDAMDYEALGVEGRIDWHLMQAHLRHELALLDRMERRNLEMAPLLPFASAIARLQEDRRHFRPMDPAGAAAALDEVRRLALATKTAFAGEAPRPGRSTALRAARRTADLRKVLQDWFDHFNGYDPEFGWWAREPAKDAFAALDEHARFLREQLVGVRPDEDEPIVGDPIGADALAEDLAREMVAYTPDELLAIAARELAWCEAEWRAVARELGLGDDWKAALERAKRDHVAPGGQPALIAAQAYEAIAFLRERDLLTIPPHAVDTWRMTMLSPERQKVAPFFLGGETIQVAFPTDGMDHATKLDSLRANNRHFCRATVHHELIPGHHLQGWYMERFNPHRTLFYTPFWIEGWALWWELHLWDLGFARSPENRAGMLFWRTHRCARIIFSLNFHLGRWTPEECVEFLVTRVGHDRHTATGEVRRSFNGDYSPLYQVAYMMGAVQIRALHAELVGSGRMPAKAFHDGILEGGNMPIELVRARLGGTLLPRDFRPSWRFADARP